MDETKLNEPRRFLGMTMRETIFVVVVSALAIGVFLGVIQVMAPDNPSQAESSPQAAEAPTTAGPPAAADDQAGDDAPASQGSSG
jgi:Na+/H+-dicarboxylate symporter